MKKKRFSRTIIAFGFLVLAIVLYQSLRDKRTTEVSPTKNGDARWRIGYYEGGSYIDYAGGLRGLVNGLAELGWITPIELPALENPDDTKVLWHFLSSNVQSNYVEFVSDAYWSSNWNDAERETNRQKAIHRLSTVKDLDLIIAMGTWAGQDLATDAHAIPTMVLTSSEPVQAGIIDSAEDSGLDHVIAEYDPYRYVRQVRLFHDIANFQRLGVVHEDSEEGQIYANLDSMHQVARERDFEIVECHASDTNIDEEIALQALVRCYHALAPKIDALWISVHQGEHPKFMPDILTPLFEYSVATWAQVGSEAVKRGALISIAQQTNYTEVGLWYASTMAKILNGALPRDLDQTFEIPLTIAINLETAREIGFDVPSSLLKVADQIYEGTERER